MQFFCEICDVNAKNAAAYQEHIISYKHAISSSAADLTAMQLHMTIRASMTELNAGYPLVEPPLHELSFKEPTKNDGRKPSTWEQRMAEVLLTLKIHFLDLIEFFPGQLTDMILKNSKVSS